MDSDQLETELGSAVRALRIDAGLSRRQLADRANVALGSLANLETGRGANVRTLVRALAALEADGWLSRLRPPDPQFSPLALSAATREEQDQASLARRVPRTRKARV